ncbi:MAG: DUF5069 domain-containing protein [Candidatus Latescibacteria bacterium]|nr:DUF5069 domain-containing protein [Candidatus Latescibacterota bacterium]
MAYPRTPYDREGGLVYFPRMLDKMRLHLNGELPEDYHDLRSNGFDGVCCQFLQVDYADVLEQIKNGASDGEVLAWCFAQGRKPTEQDIDMFNGALSKRGWRDESSERLAEIVGRNGFSPETQTWFDLIEADEERTKSAAS